MSVRVAIFVAVVGRRPRKLQVSVRPCGQAGGESLPACWSLRTTPWKAARMAWEILHVGTPLDKGWRELPGRYGCLIVGYSACAHCSRASWASVRCINPLAIGGTVPRHRRVSALTDTVRQRRNVSSVGATLNVFTSWFWRCSGSARCGRCMFASPVGYARPGFGQSLTVHRRWRLGSCVVFLAGNFMCVLLLPEPTGLERALRGIAPRQVSGSPADGACRREQVAARPALFHGPAQSGRWFLAASWGWPSNVPDRRGAHDQTAVHDVVLLT